LLLALSGAAAAQTAVPVFDDDFESGDLSRWSFVSDGGVGVAASAAHRGAWGLVARGSAVAGQGGFVDAKVTPSSATLYAARFWMKAPPTPNAGQLGVAAIHGLLTGLDFPLAEVRLTYTSGTAIGLDLGGSTPPADPTVSYTGTPIAIDSNWHLVEIAVMNINSPAGAGARAMWVDGKQVALYAAGSLTGMVVTRVLLGAPDVYVAGLNGDISFDDYRLSSQALSASQFSFPNLPGGVVANQCQEMDVALDSSERSGQLAPYTFDAGMQWSPNILTFYSDPGCGQPTGGQLSFAVGGLGAKTYFLATPGTAQLCASYVDFLCFPRLLTVVGDGGVVQDGGASADAGPPPVRDLIANLGCASGPVSGLGWALLGLVGVGLRRRHAS
jgi:MYXO-CTERM domain-containing protein